MSLSYLRGFLSFLEKEGIDDIREAGRKDIVAYLDEAAGAYTRNSLRSLVVLLRRLFTLLMRHSKITDLPDGEPKPKAAW